jgi:hypothetical protein
LGKQVGRLLAPARLSDGRRWTEQYRTPSRSRVMFRYWLTRKYRPAAALHNQTRRDLS